LSSVELTGVKPFKLKLLKHKTQINQLFTTPVATYGNHNRGDLLFLFLMLYYVFFDFSKNYVIRPLFQKYYNTLLVAQPPKTPARGERG
jgi:hypothetical protein